MGQACLLSPHAAPKAVRSRALNAPHTAGLRERLLRVILGVGTPAIGVTQIAAAAHQDTPGVAAKIEGAMSATPASISDDATSLEYTMDDAGTFVVLREGSNGWSCLPVSS